MRSIESFVRLRMAARLLFSAAKGEAQHQRVAKILKTQGLSAKAITKLRKEAADGQAKQ